MFNRILIAIITPVVAVGVIISIWATSSLVPPLLGFIQKRTESSLQLLTNLGLEKCEASFNYLLDLRLEEDPNIIKSQKRETLRNIKELSDQFDKIQLVVLDTDGVVISQASGMSDGPALMIERINISGTIVEQNIFNQPARLVRNPVRASGWCYELPASATNITMQHD